MLLAVFACAEGVIGGRDPCVRNGPLLTSGLLLGQETRKPHIVGDRFEVGSLILLNRRLGSLQDNGDNKREAARALGMSRATIYRKTNHYGIAQHPCACRPKSFGPQS